MKRAPVLILVGALALAGGLWLASVTRPPEPAPAAARPPPDVLPRIELADLAGERRSIAEWDDRPRLINFWATWCAPCRKEMPLLETFHQEHPDVAVIGIAIDREEPVRRFVGETGVSYAILHGESDAMAAAESFGDAFAALPFTVLAAPGGGILRIHTGELDARELATIGRILSDLAAGRVSAAEAREALEAIG